MTWPGQVLCGAFALLVGLLPISAARGQAGGGVTEITIKAIPGLQYDLKSFSVKAGSRVKLTLGNADDMSHNLLITRPGKREAVVNAAMELAEKGPAADYIPGTADVLWSLPVISPGQTRSVTFTAPSRAGAYPYVCTYPGHGFVMFGEMRVTGAGTSGAGKAPAAETSVPAGKTSHSGHTAAAVPPAAHPYVPEPPYLYRVFIEGASPAAIAVRLPHELSYCWDAGTCSLRYAWQGGFVDMTDLWKGHFDASAKVEGDIFFRDNTDYPLRLGGEAEVPEVEYLGYRLVDRYPEFRYRVNGTEVSELIRGAEDGNGLVREFRIPDAGRTVWFCTNGEDDAVAYTSSAGEWLDGRLKLSPEEAEKFTVTMTSYHLLYKKKEKK